MAFLEKPFATVGTTIGQGSSLAPDSLSVHASFLPLVALLEKPSAAMGWSSVHAFPLLPNQHAEFCCRCRVEGFLLVRCWFIVFLFWWVSCWCLFFRGGYVGGKAPLVSSCDVRKWGSYLSVSTLVQRYYWRSMEIRWRGAVKKSLGALSQPLFRTIVQSTSWLGGIRQLSPV